MNLLIPMAGRGKRFADEGYALPKPMIDVLGEPMIKRVLTRLLGTQGEHSIDNVIFLCLDEFMNNHLEEFKEILSPWSNGTDFHILPVKEVTEGAACTALLAKQFIDNHAELVITDCDHFCYDKNYLYEGVNYFRQKNAHGGIWCHLSDHPKWSYTKVVNGNIREVVEKQVISDLANTGDYYFRHGKDFVQYAETMISRNDRTRGEFYTAPVFQYYIADDRPLKAYLTNGMVALGTPADLLKYVEENSRG